MTKCHIAFAFNSQKKIAITSLTSNTIYHHRNSWAKTPPFIGRKKAILERVPTTPLRVLTGVVDRGSSHVSKSWDDPPRGAQVFFYGGYGGLNFLKTRWDIVAI